jgi:dTDP-4-amino-4,6-dideoxygalactose transaminase
MTKFYFYPPMHWLEAYKEHNSNKYPNSEYVSKNIICLPIYNYMEEETIEKICSAIDNININSKRISDVTK